MLYAIVKTTFNGKHRYEDAPDQVVFLRALHPHVFHVMVKVGQTHTGRDIEYFMFKQWLDEKVLPKFSNINASCELFAELILEAVRDKYPNKNIIVEVTEDGINGAGATNTP